MVVEIDVGRSYINRSLSQRASFSPKLLNHNASKKSNRSFFPASSPMEVPPEKKRKMGEASTEDAEDLGSTSGDQQVYQMDLLSCLVCTLKAHWDSSDNHNEEYCEAPLPFSRPLPEFTDVTSSHISSAHASCSSFSDALVRILRHANQEREVACCRSIYRYESSEGQGMVAIVKVGPSESRLSQIGEGERTNFKILVKIMEASQEPGILFTFDSSRHYARASLPGLSLKHFYVGGGRMNFKILVKIMEASQGPGILFTFDSSHHYARASLLGLNLKHFFVGGMQLLRMAKILFSKGGLVPIKLLPFILDPPVEAKVVEKEGNWSSLPVLPLLMIMDKLDIFDNKRLTAVCKDWQYAATMQYPKRRYSIGDGVPWIWHAKYGWESTSREFIRGFGTSARKFTVDMPEFAKSSVISSRGGWILLQHCNVDHPELTCSWFLVNPFTRDSIELPKREVHNKASCRGSFTLRDSDGYPERIVLIHPKPNFQASVITACPGDMEWRIIHDYTGLKTNVTSLFTLVLIRDTAYCRDPCSVITAFNVANNSKKVLPRTPRDGFIAEHKGELIYVKIGECIVNKRKSFVLVLRCDEESSSWKTMRPVAVMGTGWYKSGRHNIIADKGKGLKFYNHTPKLDSNNRLQFHYVRRRDLLTGKDILIRVPSLADAGQCWVAIG